ncbi:MAG TPA: hypothetical protein DD381_04340 [Lentisphaeria bacterium]|nr:MAG: hypothetical protein A2X47_07310 [Lentisphaerae bacterium GWF2_38_69]HBM15561.1 hypothetical protein [Lentisphaeria bacterium]
MIKVSAYRYEYKEDPPVKISFHTWHYRPNVIVRLEHKDSFGLGESAPLLQITGDDQTSVIEEIKSLNNFDINPETTTASDFHLYLDKIELKSITLRTALDFAYHDLKAKLLGIPVWRMFSDSIIKIPNSVTVYLKDSLEETALEAKRLITKFPLMKVMKIKLSGEGDFERCQAVKKILQNHDIVFSLDANQGYSDPSKAVSSLNQIIKLLGKVLLIEEPCPKGELDKLRFVKENIVNSLIFADESAVNIEDVRTIIDKKAAHGINIKLQKAGGIYKGREIASLAVKHGLKLMVGAMLEGSLGMAAGIHFSNDLQNLILKDLDTDLDMEEHFNGKIPFLDGFRLPCSMPGLGISFNETLIMKLKEKNLLTLQQIT